MKRLWFVGAVLYGCMTMGAAAQEPTPEPAPQAQPRPPGGGPGERPRVQYFTRRRARLGVSVNVRARETDSIGAYINSVTPGGPAARAGIRTGDIVVKLDGKSVLGGGGRDRDYGDKDESAPGLRLIELAAQLDPSDTINIELRRGKETKTLRLITGDESSYAYVMPGGQDAMETVRDRLEQAERDMQRIPMDHRRTPRAEPGYGFAFGFGGQLADLELAPMNPDLGRYFGVSEGILVISVPDDSRLGLKAGDVVLNVDGRVPTSPAHLIRILRSYEEGEQFKLDVVRMKKKETVTGQVGEKERDEEE